MLLLVGVLCGCGTVQKDHVTGRLKWWPFIIEGDPTLLSIAELSEAVALAKRELAAKGRDGNIFKIRIVSAQAVEAHYGANLEISGEYLTLERAKGKWQATESVIWIR